MRIINSILKRAVNDSKKILGRWSIETCDKKMNNKIDLANEDHCGPCGQYMLNKLPTINNNNNNINNNNNNIIKKP